MSQRTIKRRNNLDEPEDLDSIIVESYDSFVRLERRNLLVSSSVTLIAYFGDATTGIFNTSIMRFPAMSENMLFTILIITSLYFLVAYLIYAYPGYRTSKNKWKKLTSSQIEITSNFHLLHIEKEMVLSDSRFLIWQFISFYLPVLMGLMAIAVGLLKIACQ